MNDNYYLLLNNQNVPWFILFWESDENDREEWFFYTFQNPSYNKREKNVAQ